MPVGDIIELTCVQAVYGVPCYNVFEFSVIIAPTDGSNELVDLMTQFETTVLPKWADIVAAECFFLCLRTRRKFPSTGVSLTNGALSTTQGTRTGESLPADECALMNFRATTAGPKKRGKKYFSGISEDDESNGTLTPGIVAPLDVFRQQLIDPLEISPGVKGKYEMGAYDEVGAVFHQFASSEYQGALYNLRTRNRSICGGGIT